MYRGLDKCKPKQKIQVNCTCKTQAMIWNWILTKANIDNIEKLPDELVDKERWGKLKNRGQGGQDGRPEEVEPETSERVHKIISVIF